MKEISKIRKEVMTIANRLYKTLKDLSIAAKRAWQIVKGKKIITKVSGVTFGSRQEALKRIEKYMQSGSEIKTTLELDKDNEYDPNAVKVNISINGSAAYHLGYLPKDLAVILSPVIDKIGTIQAYLIGVVGGYADYAASLGARIAIYL